MTTIKVNRDSSVTLNDQITRQVIFAVMSGDLSPGDKLQSVRELGPEIEANINTVGKAYQGLEDMGVIYSRQGIGYFVTQDGFAKAEAWVGKYITDALGLIYREAFAAQWTGGDLTDVLREEFKEKDVY